MRGAADLDVAPDRRGAQRVEQPARIRVGAHCVPLAPDDRNGCADEPGVIGELAGPGVVNVLKCAAWDLYRRRRMGSALRVDIEVVLAPFREMAVQQDGRSPGGTVSVKRFHWSSSEIRRQPGSGCARLPALAARSGRRRPADRRVRGSARRTARSRSFPTNGRRSRGGRTCAARR